jgi:AhpD family alkylhydroperoxidase
MEKQLELDNERRRLVGKFAEAIPNWCPSEFALLDEVYKDGALSRKVKELIAMAIGLRVGCTNCILDHTIKAVEAGATKDEIMETLSVEVAMSGTTGWGESLRVIKLLEEMGKW